MALIAIGITMMLYTSTSLVRALRIAHVLAWEEPFRRRAGLLRDGAILSAALVGMLAIEAGITYVRALPGLERQALSSRRQTARRLDASTQNQSPLG